MDEDRSRGEGIFEVLEGRATGVTEVPENTFAGQVGQRSDDTRVIIYKMPVEICKAKEGLHVLDLPRLRLVLYGLHLLQRHSKSGGWQLITKILSGFGVQLTLLRFGKEAICAELLEDFLDMLLVGGHVSRVDEDVVQVFYNANI